MYNPRNYAIAIERILGTPEYLTGEIEKDPLAFLSSFLDKKYDTDKRIAKLIDEFDEKFSKYKTVPLCSWFEEDAKQLVDDLKKIYSL
ncbi:MAG: hypothetical protein IJ270_01195 [Paludibacteraceae bacterium]|nr:hypothetical protein [Paludibacteraceae bacterium]